MDLTTDPEIWAGDETREWSEVIEQVEIEASAAFVGQAQVRGMVLADVWMGALLVGLFLGKRATPEFVAFLMEHVPERNRAVTEGAALRILAGFAASKKRFNEMRPDVPGARA